MNKPEVITLIQKIRELGDADHARDVYKLANEAFPEWELKQAFESMMGEK
jgi:DNA polymerase III delta prime subunit